VDSYVRWTHCSSARRSIPKPGPNQLASTTNQPFTAFPSDFGTLPTVSFVVPNLCDDAHDSCDANGDIATMDAWLQANISPYALWAQTHNSLLMVTFDESIGGDHPFYTVFAMRGLPDMASCGAAGA